MWLSEDKLRSKSFACTLFETICCSRLYSQAGWPRNFLRFCWICLPSCHGSTQVTNCMASLGFMCVLRIQTQCLHRNCFTRSSIFPVPMGDFQSHFCLHRQACIIVSYPGQKFLSCQGQLQTPVQCLETLYRGKIGSSETCPCLEATQNIQDLKTRHRT